MRNDYSRVNQIIQAAKNVAKCRETISRIEEIQFYNGYSEPGYSGELIAVGNWNNITNYNADMRQHECVDDTLGRLSELLEKIGFSLEWSDEWSSCEECGNLVRTSPDSYSWLPYYTIVDDCSLVCKDCIDCEEYLNSLEGCSEKANVLEIDPSDYGYVQISKFENGFHPGQNDDPKKIANKLEENGVSRYLFSVDDKGQFDIHFSVYVHSDEVELAQEVFGG